MGADSHGEKADLLPCARARVHFAARRVMPSLVRVLEPRAGVAPESEPARSVALDLLTLSSRFKLGPTTQYVIFIARHALVKTTPASFGRFAI
jgi:hypothetical protein